MKYPQITAMLVSCTCSWRHTITVERKGYASLAKTQSCRGNTALHGVSEEARGYFCATARASTQRKLPSVFDAQGAKGAIVVPALRKACSDQVETQIRSDSDCGAQDVRQSVCLLRQHQSQIPSAGSQEQRRCAGTRAPSSSHSRRKLFQVCVEQASPSRFAAVMCELSSRETLWGL